MAQFSIRSNRARMQADEELDMVKELDFIEDSIRNVSSNLRFKVASQAGIRACLNRAADCVSAYSGGMSGMHNALVNILDNYERTEKRITNDAVTDESNKKNASGSGWPEVIGGLLTIPGQIHGGIVAFEDFVNNIKDRIVEQTGFDVKGIVEGAYYENEISCENGSLGVSISAYEAYAAANGGVFTVDEDGNLVFNPHVNAEVGASYTVLSAHGDYAVGDDMLGAAVNGSIIVGQVSGVAAVSAGLMDENGNFDPHASVNASAEAILVDAKAQAGVTVLGTEAEVEAGVNIGVGAHANIEFGDGKLEFDIGASLGIGVSISASIDFGGTIDAIQDGCKSFFDKLTPW